MENKTLVYRSKLATLSGSRIDQVIQYLEPSNILRSTKRKVIERVGSVQLQEIEKKERIERINKKKKRSKKNEEDLHDCDDLVVGCVAV